MTWFQPFVFTKWEDVGMWVIRAHMTGHKSSYITLSSKSINICNHSSNFSYWCNRFHKHNTMDSRPLLVFNKTEYHIWFFRHENIIVLERFEISEIVSLLAIPSHHTLGFFYIDHDEESPYIPRTWEPQPSASNDRLWPCGANFLNEDYIFIKTQVNNP